MDAERLVSLYPRLYHMAELGCWEKAKAQGLLSTSGLLDLYEYDGAERYAIESDIRPDSVTIEHPIHGTAVIRDNKPLRRGNLEKRLLGMDVADWCEMLNRHVFLWPTEDHLSTLLNARAYKNLQHEVITFDTARVVDRFGARVRLSPINSGNTIYPPKRQYGVDTFCSIADYPYEERVRARSIRDAIVEVAVEGSLGDVEELAVVVERRRGEEILEVIASTS